jgi:hypothetical protein
MNFALKLSAELRSDQKRDTQREKYASSSYSTIYRLVQYQTIKED